jgi:hypothetical protein
MAAVAGVAQRSWSDWERHDPQQMAALARVARHYEVSADYLLGLTDDPRPGQLSRLSPAGTTFLRMLQDMSEDAQRDAAAVVQVLYEADQRRQADLEYLKTVLDNVTEQIGGKTIDELTGWLQSSATGNLAADTIQALLDAIRTARTRLE